MKYLFFVISLNLGFVFFSLISIFGIEFKGLNESPMYLIFNVIVTLVSLYYVFLDLLNVKSRHSRLNLFFYFLPILIVLLYFIEFSGNKLTKNVFILFLSFSVPALFIGTHLSKIGGIQAITKWWDLLIILITAGIVSMLPKMIFERAFFVANMDYQRISYFAGFAFSLTLYFLLFGKTVERFGLFKSKSYGFISVLLLVINFLTVFFSTGRGGFVVIVFSTAVMLYYKLIEKRGIKNISLFILIGLSLFLSVNLVLPQNLKDLILLGSERVFSYFTSKGIDLSETSGRDLIYSDALKIISDNLILGSGFFGYFEKLKGYPHNLFLEFLLQGGIVYFTFWIFVLILFLRKIHRLIRFDRNNLIILPVCIYPFTLLLFSDTYIGVPLFWFSIAYVFNYQIRNKYVDGNNSNT